MMNDEEKRRREKKTVGEYTAPGKYGGKYRAPPPNNNTSSRPKRHTTMGRNDMLIVWEREERGYVGRSGAKGKQPPTEIARPASEIHNER